MAMLSHPPHADNLAPTHRLHTTLQKLRDNQHLHDSSGGCQYRLRADALSPDDIFKDYDDAAARLRKVSKGGVLPSSFLRH